MMSVKLFMLVIGPEKNPRQADTLNNWGFKARFKQQGQEQSHLYYSKVIICVHIWQGQWNIMVLKTEQQDFH